MLTMQIWGKRVILCSALPHCEQTYGHAVCKMTPLGRINFIPDLKNTADDAWKPNTNRRPHEHYCWRVIQRWKHIGVFQPISMWVIFSITLITVQQSCFKQALVYRCPSPMLLHCTTWYVINPHPRAVIVPAISHNAVFYTAHISHNEGCITLGLR